MKQPPTAVSRSPLAPAAPQVKSSLAKTAFTSGSNNQQAQNSQPQEAPDTDDDDAVFCDHFGFSMPPNIIDEYLSSFEYWFTDVLPMQEAFYTDIAAKYIRGDTIIKNKEVIGYSRMGISIHHRGEMWMLMTGSKTKMAQNKGLYQELLAKHNCTSTAATQQIERDLHRTFVGNPLLGVRRQ
jgi:hypothetical protein